MQVHWNKQCNFGWFTMASFIDGDLTCHHCMLHTHVHGAAQIVAPGFKITMPISSIHSNDMYQKIHILSHQIKKATSLFLLYTSSVLNIYLVKIKHATISVWHCRNQPSVNDTVANVEWPSCLGQLTNILEFLIW